MSVLISLLLGLGVFVTYDGLTRRRQPGLRVARRPVAAWMVRHDLGHLAPRQFLAASAAAGLGAGAIALALIGSTGVALVAMLGGAALPAAVHRSRQRTIRAERRQAWPDAIELLAGAVRTGDTLPAALGVVAERGPETLRPVFRSVLSDHRVTGDLGAALERLGEAAADPVADRVVRTLVLAHRVGGRELGRLLRTLAAFLRDDLAARREIEARQSWTVIAARVSAAAPWLVLFLVASRPQGARAFDSPSGLMVLLVGAAVTVIGYRMMLRLGRLAEEPRVLRAVAP